MGSENRESEHFSQALAPAAGGPERRPEGVGEKAGKAALSKLAVSCSKNWVPFTPGVSGFNFTGSLNKQSS